jgi:uncharacterized OB-fold protein
MNGAVRKCDGCGEQFVAQRQTCPNCGSTEIEIIKRGP